MVGCGGGAGEKCACSLLAHTSSIFNLEDTTRASGFGAKDKVYLVLQAVPPIPHRSPLWLVTPRYPLDLFFRLGARELIEYINESVWR